MNSCLMTSIFLFHDKNTSINDKSIISEKVYFCNVNFTRHPRRQIHQSLQKNRLNLSLIYDAEHSVILTELQSALRLSPHSLPHSLTSMLLRISGKFPKRFCMVGTRHFESTEKVQFFKDQNEKCLRFITFLSTNRLNKAMIGRKRRVKRLFLRY